MRTKFSFAKAAPKRSGEMNKTEAEYAKILESKKRNGEIVDYAYECERLVLAKACNYTPDFRVINGDGFVEFHEIKGSYIHDDSSLVRIKTAARLHPYRFFLCQKLAKKNGGGWNVTEVKA